MPDRPGSVGPRWSDGTRSTSASRVGTRRSGIPLDRDHADPGGRRSSRRSTRTTPTSASTTAGRRCSSSPGTSTPGGSSTRTTTPRWSASRRAWAFMAGMDPMILPSKVEAVRSRIERSESWGTPEVEQRDGLWIVRAKAGRGVDLHGAVLTVFVAVHPARVIAGDGHPDEGLAASPGRVRPGLRTDRKIRTWRGTPGGRPASIRRVGVEEGRIREGPALSASPGRSCD